MSLSHRDSTIIATDKGQQSTSKLFRDSQSILDI